MAGNNLSKEKIKSRMLRNAARLWDAEEADVEVAFDPIVTMMIEGCVNEIEKISDDIANTQFRVINRIAELLTPDVITAPYPAHCILYARPTEAQTTITPELQFFFMKKISAPAASQQEVMKEIFFSPLSSFKLIDGSVRYYAFANRIYETKNGYQKSLAFEADSRRLLENNVLWLGLEVNAKVESLAGLTFYFDVRNNPGYQTFYNLLPHAKWMLNDELLDAESGWVFNDRKLQIADEFDLNKRIRSETEQLYKKCFFRITTPQKNELRTLKKKYPEKFTEAFRYDDLDTISEPLIWLKITFPPAVTNELLGDVMCNINCFPIVNKRLNEFTFRLQPNINIVPLSTPDYFLSVNKVTTSDLYEYSSNPLSSSKNYSAGTYTLRHGGVQRFDQRNAMETIQYLLDMLRDESAAFSVLGNDFLTSTIRQFNALIALLEQRSGRVQSNDEPTSYLSMSPRQQGENVFVSFWSSNGETANNLRAGSKLELYSGGDVRSDSLYLMTASKGGKNRMNDLERLSAFRSSLIARGRIVTPNDVRLFCEHKLGDNLKDVKVKKGFTIGSDSKTGFMQTIEVIITPTEKLTSSLDQWESISSDLAEALQRRSSSFIPFKVIIRNEKTGRS